MEKDETKEVNSFARMMQMFPDDDTLYIEPFDESCEVVVGSPMSTVTNNIKFGMSMVSSFEEAVAAGYKVATDGRSAKLDEKLNQHFHGKE